MIFESFPWKQDLRRRKNLIIKYNTAEHFEKNDDTTYTVIEKAIFYSAFIIRKLIDCGGKRERSCSYGKERMQLADTFLYVFCCIQ